MDIQYLAEQDILTHYYNRLLDMLKEFCHHIIDHRHNKKSKIIMYYLAHKEIHKITKQGKQREIEKHKGRRKI